MKTSIGIVLLAIAAIALSLFLVHPKDADVGGIADPDAGVECLRDVPAHYQRRLLTFSAWYERWLAHSQDKWGISLTPSRLEFFKSYIALETDVACYQALAHDRSLSMSLGPAEFRAVYNVLANGRQLAPIP